MNYYNTSDSVNDPLSRELRFQEIIFNDFKLEDDNPYAYDIKFLERLHAHYKNLSEKKVCKKISKRIISVKKYNTAFTAFLS